MHRESAVWGLMIAAQKARNRVERLLRRYDLRAASYRLLKNLASTPDGCLTIHELRILSELECPDMTRMLDRLENNGWIVRVDDPSDRRLVGIQITDSGLSTLTEVEELVAKVCEDITRKFDDIDIIGLKRNFEIITEATEDVYA